jgi:hypothetical protein
MLLIVVVLPLVRTQIESTIFLLHGKGAWPGQACCEQWEKLRTDAVVDCYT